MYCRACAYDLSGAPDPRCPECGRAFDPGNPRTYLRSLAWRRHRRWVCAAIALLVLYLVAPRGYVKGVAVLFPSAGSPSERITQWRLAPPRWLWAVPYPLWTLNKPATPGASVSGTAPSCDTRIERVRWFRPPEVVASVSMIDNGLNARTVHATLSTLVRRQCEGYTGVWVSPDDSTIPAYMRDEKDPW